MQGCYSPVKKQRVVVGNKESGGGFEVQDVRSHGGFFRLADIGRVGDDNIYHLVIYHVPFIEIFGHLVREDICDLEVDLDLIAAGILPCDGDGFGGDVDAGDGP